MDAAIDALLALVARKGFRRGMGGDWAWLALAGAAYVLRRARRRDDPSTTLTLHPGDRYLVSVHQPGGGAA